jgi:hypothetical protein
MKKHYQLICMAFDGHFVVENPHFEDIDRAWDYSNDLGSKWYFYPYHFVISGKTIASAPCPFKTLEGQRISKVSEIFKEHAALPEAQGLDVEQFAYFLTL